MPEPGIAALSRCYVCGKPFMFDPDRVPSILIDPLTRLPPDVAADGSPITASPEAVQRSRREPYCPACARGLNAELRRQGKPAAFDETDTARAITREVPDA